MAWPAARYELTLRRQNSSRRAPGPRACVIPPPVEYAAELADERPADERTTAVVSFKAAFERTEACDDASANRASILDALHRLFPDGVKFDAAKVVSRLKESEKWSEDNHVPEDACIVDLRHFCTSSAPTPRVPNPRTSR